MKLKLNKKIVLTTLAVPVAIATPVAVAVSCGTPTNSTDIKSQPERKIDKYTDKQLDSYSATPYSKEAIKSVYSSFTNTLKFTENFKGELKVQSIKVLDSAIIALFGYLRENDSANADSDNLAPTAKAEHIKKLKIAKLHFSENLQKLKVQVDKLFDLIATGDGETVMGDLLGGLMNKQAAPISPAPVLAKPNAVKKESPIVSIAKLAFGKIKLVLDNMIDTLINIEHPNEPAWKNKATVTKLGSLQEIANSSITPGAVAIPTNTNNLELIKKINAFLDGELTNAMDKEVIRPFKSKGVDIVDDYSDAFITAPLAKTMVKPIDQPEISIEGNGFKSGLKLFKEVAKNSPEKLIIYQDSTTKDIFFEIDTTTHKMADAIRKNIKYNEKHVGALLNDTILNDVLLGPLLKSKDMKIVMPGTTEILDILGHPSRISGLLGKVDAMLGDFGKALQFTELDLQMAISNLSGNDAQYYGEIKFDTQLNSYKMQKNAFISPQFNIFDIKNYESNNKKIKEGIKTKKIVDAHIRKTVATINVDIPVLEFVDRLTVDPYSNYTFSLMELVSALKLKDIAV